MTRYSELASCNDERKNALYLIKRKERGRTECVALSKNTHKRHKLEALRKLERTQHTHTHQNKTKQSNKCAKSQWHPLFFLLLLLSSCAFSCLSLSHKFHTHTHNKGASRKKKILFSLLLAFVPALLPSIPLSNLFGPMYRSVSLSSYAAKAWDSLLYTYQHKTHLLSFSFSLFFFFVRL